MDLITHHENSMLNQDWLLISGTNPGPTFWNSLYAQNITILSRHLENKIHVFTYAFIYRPLLLRC